MSHELLAHSSYEKQTPSQDIDALLKDARDALYYLPQDSDFEQSLVNHGLGSADFDKPAYWRLAAEFAKQSADISRARGEDSSKIVLRELFAATPDFIYNQAYVEKHKGSYGKDIYDDRARVSYFNGLIREAALTCPDLSASTLINSINGVVNMTIEDPALQEATTRYAKDHVRGVQHEIAFGQLLAGTGRNFRLASVNEDLRGIDYVVSGKAGNLNIDVKASLSQVEAKGQTTQPYTVARDGNITMYSLIKDNELNDHFTVPEAIIAQRSEYLDGLLDEISQPQQQYQKSASLVS